jgi:hypothetical protein
MGRVLITQNLLVRLFQERGWKRVYPNFINEASQDSFYFESRGVSIWEKRGEYVISIQGGEGLYSKPRARAKEYELVEFSIWKSSRDNGTKTGPFIKYGKPVKGGGEMHGFQTYEELMKAVYDIETRSPGNEPVESKFFRKNAPYKDLK